MYLFILLGPIFGWITAEESEKALLVFIACVVFLIYAKVTD
jgi:hypothetical protein